MCQRGGRGVGGERDREKESTYTWEREREIAREPFGSYFYIYIFSSPGASPVQIGLG